MFARCHPWVGYQRPSPKYVAREMLELSDTFNQYVSRYGLKRSEGLLLRYLTDCYRALRQTVPAEAVDENLEEAVKWLEAVVRRVDSSLIEEWETPALRRRHIHSSDSSPSDPAKAPADSTADAVQ